MARVHSGIDDKGSNRTPVLLAILFAVSSVDAVLYLSFGGFNPIVALIVLSLMPISIVAIMISRDFFAHLERGWRSVAPDTISRTLSRSLQLAFLILILVAWLSLMLNSVPYHRSLIGFLATAGAVTLVAAQILVGAGSARYLLLQICLLGLTIRLMPLSIIPFFFGDDPFLHESFVRGITSSGHIPTETSYSSFPGMHTHIAVTQYVAGLSFKSSTIASLVLVQNTVWPIIIYAAAVRFFSDRRIGLLSALLLCSSDVVTWYGLVGAFPTTFALTLLLFVLFMLSRASWQPRDFLVILVMTTGILLSHTLTALVLVIVLLVVLVLHSRAGNGIASNASRSFLQYTTIASALLVFAYWIYSADFVFDRLIRTIFMREGVIASFATEAGSEYAARIPVSQYVLDLLSQFALACLAMVGLLAVYSRRSHSLGRATILIGLLFFVFGGIGQAFAFGYAPDRWLYYAYVFLPIGGGCGLAALWKIRGHQARKTLAVLICTFVIFSFFTISDSRANNDSPFYSTDLVSPRYIMSSEFDAVDFLVEVYDGPIGTDNDLGSYIKTMQNDNQVKTISFNDIMLGEFDGTLIIRQHFDSEPVYSRGLYRITYDIKDQMNLYHFSMIVDSGTIECYVK